MLSVHSSYYSVILLYRIIVGLVKINYVKFPTCSLKRRNTGIEKVYTFFATEYTYNRIHVNLCQIMKRTMLFVKKKNEGNSRNIVIKTTIF